MEKEIGREIEYNPITQGNIWKEIIMYSLPLLLGTFFQQLYNSIDAVIVGKFVGKEALSAVGGSSGVIVNLFVGFFVGISAGAGVVVAQYFGAGKKEKLVKTVYTSFFISVVGGVLLMVPGLLLAPYLIDWMGTPIDVRDGSILYLRVYFAGLIVNMLYNVGAGVMRSMGDSKRPLYYLVIGCVLNIIFDIIFVVYFHMGVLGVALATILCQFITAVMVTYALSKSIKKYEDKSIPVKSDNYLMGRILKIGFPAGIQSLMYTLSNIIIQAVINSFGTDTVAAWTAYGKIDAIFWMVCSSFGVTVTTFVSQNYGAGKYQRVKASIRKCFIITDIFAIAMSIILYFYGSGFYRFFTDDINVINIGTDIMKFMVPFYIAYVAVEIYSGALRGMGDALIPMIIDFFGVCLLRVLWIVIVTPFKKDIILVLTSYPVTWAVTSIMFFFYFKWYVKKRRIFNCLDRKI